VIGINKGKTWITSYLPCKTYNIPIALVVNSDQIGMHLMPIVGKCTWESKGTKHSKVSRIKDKKQMMFIISSSMNGLLFPLQVLNTHVSNP
jgi:hypothetical protein